MSELDKWDKDSKKATGAISGIVFGLLVFVSKAIVDHIVKSSEDASYNGAKKAGTEENLKREQRRKGLDKRLHKKDLKDAQKEYDKYH